MAGKTFTKIKKSKSLEEFNRYCWTIANDYGKSELHIARSYFMENYGISENCFRSILDYAVIHYLVSDWLLDQMEHKAMTNQQRRSNSSGSTSYYHYQKIRDQRRQFVFQLAEDYAENTDKPLDYFLNKYGRGEKGFRNILEKALASCDFYGITDEMARTIKSHMLADFSPRPEKLQE